jgi:hypothetical protein
MTIGAKTRFSLDNTSQQQVYTITEDGTLNFRFANRIAAPNNITMWICPPGSAAPTNADIVDPACLIAPNGILEDTGIVVSNGERIFCQATIAGISGRIMGA